MPVSVLRRIVYPELEPARTQVPHGDIQLDPGTRKV